MDLCEVKLVMHILKFFFKQMERYFCFSTAADLKGRILHFALTPNCACEQGKTETINLCCELPAEHLFNQKHQNSEKIS